MTVNPISNVSYTNKIVDDEPINEFQEHYSHQMYQRINKIFCAVASFGLVGACGVMMKNSMDTEKKVILESLCGTVILASMFGAGLNRYVYQRQYQLSQSKSG